jgi:hypothetical protein
VTQVGHLVRRLASRRFVRLVHVPVHRQGVVERARSSRGTERRCASVLIEESVCEIVNVWRDVAVVWCCVSACE